MSTSSLDNSQVFNVNPTFYRVTLREVHKTVLNRVYPVMSNQQLTILH
jgi:hypothetical protein